MSTSRKTQTHPRKTLRSKGAQDSWDAGEFELEMPVSQELRQQNNLPPFLLSFLTAFPSSQNTLAVSCSCLSSFHYRCLTAPPSSICPSAHPLRSPPLRCTDEGHKPVWKGTKPSLTDCSAGPGEGAAGQPASVQMSFCLASLVSIVIFFSSNFPCRDTALALTLSSQICRQCFVSPSCCHRTPATRAASQPVF